MKCEKCGGETSILHNGICFDCAAAGVTGTFKLDITPCKQCGKTRKPLVNGLCLECSAERENHENIQKRLQHLLESDFIRSFDKVDSKGQYRRNIKDADIIVMENRVNQMTNRTITPKGSRIIATTMGMLDTIGSMEGAVITERLANAAIDASRALLEALEGER